ncbi:MAG: hypothetical protein JNL62_09110 [Bryobacterales bacterium]|nr:hypothetical protein [Bryobacterales bacterium]
MERLKEVLGRFAASMEHAGIPYEVVGGLAVYFQVERVSPDMGRLTRDIDVLVHRQDVQRIANAAESFGFLYRHAAGLDMLVDAHAPSAAKAIHLVFSAEKVRPNYAEPTPEIAPERLNSAWVAPVAHLLLMKLTSYRLKDRVHVQDMDNAGLITPQLEAQLTEALRLRLAEIRRTE